MPTFESRSATNPPVATPARGGSAWAHWYWPAQLAAVLIDRRLPF
jgi:hypothetical protein